MLWKSTEEPSSKIWWAVFSVFFISFYQLSLRLSSISLFAKQFLTRKLFKARSNSPILLFKNPFIILFLQCQWIYRKSKIPSAICCCGCWGKSRIIELNECVGYLWYKKLNTQTSFWPRFRESFFCVLHMLTRSGRSLFFLLVKKVC